MNSTQVHENDINQQKQLMSNIRTANEACGKKLFAYVDTYGCQQNESDSEKLRGMLIEMGYEITGDEYKADIAIINTCAIRENAENRVLGNVGELVHIKKTDKKRKVVFCGCLAAVPETVAKVKESYEHVNLVFPPNQLWRFPELLHKTFTEKKRVFEPDCENAQIAEGLPQKRDSEIKAWLPIMYGCNNFCSYCIVPFVRGRERSRDTEAVLSEATSLIETGYKDITLLGQNVNSYKGDLNFAQLMSAINSFEGDYLLRFMTSHPKDAGAELFSAMAENERIAKHIHLPFQAGSDRILKLMNRGYTAAQYLDKLAEARGLMPDIVITSDVIVGFPGETEEEFEETLNLVKAADFEAMFTFIYSKRPGTPAEKLEDDVTREEKQVRFERLMTLQNEISERKHARYVGTTIKVLVDGEARSEIYPLKARTNGGRLVHLIGPQDTLGKFINAKITHSNNWSLFGEAL